MSNVYEDEEDGLLDDTTSESSRLLSGSEAQTGAQIEGTGVADEEDVPAKVHMMDQSIHLALIMTMLLLSVVIFGFFHKYRRQAIDFQYNVASVTSTKADSLAATIEDLELRHGLVEKEDPPVHPLLERVMVSISSSWDVQRLTYLERVLMGINEWKAPRVDVCIGSNAPHLHQYILSNSLKDLNASGNIHTCPLPGDLFHPTALNWRTREILGERYLDTEANYTAFVFLEDDLVLSWEALVAWAEDTMILDPYGLKRSFFRTEVHYETALPMHQEYLGDNQWVNYVSLPVAVEEERVKNGAIAIEDGTQEAEKREKGYEVQQAERETREKGRERRVLTTRRFVQLPSYTYSGMFAASRAQLKRYMRSRFWDIKTGAQCCDEGAREFASWGFQYAEVPSESWRSTGLIPWSEATDGMDTVAMLMHRPNNYVVQMGHTKASKFSLFQINNFVREHMRTQPPVDVILVDLERDMKEGRGLREGLGEGEGRRLAEFWKEIKQRHAAMEGGMGEQRGAV